LISTLTNLADDLELDTQAWFRGEGHINPQTLRPEYSAYDTVDQNANMSPMTDRDKNSYPWYTEALLPQSQFWPCQEASANAQSLNPAIGPIPIAYTEYASNDQVDITRLVPNSASAKRPREQTSLDEGSTGDEQMTPHSAKSASSAVLSPSQPKVPRRTSPKGQVPVPAAATHPTRTPHNLIERRYRHKLQSELDNLTSKIPGWETESHVAGLDIENAEHTLKSRSKASAIAAAAKHIERLERDNESKALFVMKLQGQIEGLQKLVHCDDCAILRCLQDSRMTCAAE
jgi:hypothetical protein